jgi:hypothetical protein
MFAFINIVGSTGPVENRPCVFINIPGLIVKYYVIDKSSLRPLQRITGQNRWTKSPAKFAFSYPANRRIPAGIAH